MKQKLQVIFLDQLVGIAGLDQQHEILRGQWLVAAEPAAHFTVVIPGILVVEVEAVGPGPEEPDAPSEDPGGDAESGHLIDIEA